MTRSMSVRRLLLAATVLLPLPLAACPGVTASQIIQVEADAAPCVTAVQSAVSGASGTLNQALAAGNAAAATPACVALDTATLNVITAALGNVQPAAPVAGAVPGKVSTNPRFAPRLISIVASK